MLLFSKTLSTLVMYLTMLDLTLCSEFLILFEPLIKEIVLDDICLKIRKKVSVETQALHPV